MSVIEELLYGAQGRRERKKRMIEHQQYHKT
jgi:hypothetical protein